MKARALQLFVISVLAGPWAARAGAQGGYSSTRLLPSDGAAGNRFAYGYTPMGISGDYAVIGACNDDDNGNLSGSAYVFRRTASGWVQQTKLLPADGGAVQVFGWSARISDDSILVGAPYDDDQGFRSGSAYVFRRGPGGWAQEAKLLAADGGVGHCFGYSVAISGSRALIAAPFDNDNGADSGSAYVFERTPGGWVQTAKLHPVQHFGCPDCTECQFGDSSVALSGDTAIIGAWNYPGSCVIGVGAAFIFELQGGSWIERAMFLECTYCEFGRGVAISGNTALVTKENNGMPGSEVYVYERGSNGWVRTGRLSQAAGTSNPSFGIAVDLSGDLAVTGSGDSYQALPCYVFERGATGWSQKAVLLPGDAGPTDVFGYAVAISGETAMASSAWADSQGVDSGEAYVFQPVPSSSYCYGDGSGAPCPCGNSGSIGQGCENSFGTRGALLSATGTASLLADTVTLRAGGLPHSDFAILVQGTEAANPGIPLGDGLRCIGGQLRRLGARTAAPDGSLAFGHDVPGDPQISIAGGIPLGGGVRRYQVYYRDSNPNFCTPERFNLSNGIRIPWYP